MDDKITLTCTDGSTISLYPDAPGMKTGYGCIVNGYAAGIEYFDKYSDGDTVIECGPDHPQAMPVADAYQAFRKQCEDEAIEYAVDGILHMGATYEEYGAYYGEAFEATIRAEVVKRLQARMGDPTPLKQNPFGAIRL